VYHDATMQETDVIIVGAGPIGIELAVTLKRAGVDSLHFEAGQIGQTIFNWPRFTRFLSNPETLAIAGVPTTSVGQDRLTGEEYLAYLRGVVRQFDLNIATYHRVVDIAADQGGFTVKTLSPRGESDYRCRRIVLAVGDMAANKRLGVPGEDLPHVRHWYTDPHEFFGKRVLIVGGRNTAVEAALRCHRIGAEVTLSYRRAQIDPLLTSHKLGPLIEDLISGGHVRFLPETLPVAFTTAGATLAAVDLSGRPADLGRFEEDADFVLVLVGFTADTRLFDLAGVTFTGPEGSPTCNPETMETNIPGVYVAGTAAVAGQQGHSLFIETSHAHVEKIARALQGDR